MNYTEHHSHQSGKIHNDQSEHNHTGGHEDHDHSQIIEDSGYLLF